MYFTSSAKNNHLKNYSENIIRKMLFLVIANEILNKNVMEKSDFTRLRC